MMMPTGTMYMAVVQFFIGCVANRNDGTGELQLLVGQRMVEIHSDQI